MLSPTSTLLIDPIHSDLQSLGQLLRRQDFLTLHRVFVHSLQRSCNFLSNLLDLQRNNLNSRSTNGCSHSEQTGMTENVSADV
jgi:hypothetical protein